jgi:hypothetical protein
MGRRNNMKNPFECVEKTEDLIRYSTRILLPPIEGERWLSLNFSKAAKAPDALGTLYYQRYVHPGGINNIKLMGPSVVTGKYFSEVTGHGPTQSYVIKLLAKVKGEVTIKNGVAHLPCGTTIDLEAIQE